MELGEHLKAHLEVEGVDLYLLVGVGDRLGEVVEVEASLVAGEHLLEMA